jgi:hypothetical protein
MNISHLRCGPVGVRFIESRFAGRHKCRPYKDLKRKFLYYELSRLRRDFFDRPALARRKKLCLGLAINIRFRISIAAALLTRSGPGINTINKIFLYSLYLPAGRPVLNIPGPDLAWQDAVMQSEAFISSENSCISTSHRTRAGLSIPGPDLAFVSLRVLQSRRARRACLKNGISYTIKLKLTNKATGGK